MTGFAPVSYDDHSSTQKFIGQARILGPKWTHLPTLTIGFLGVQIFWSVEMSYASPYLLSLGLSKPSMAIVFLAGPLSGLIIQPLIGALADSTTSRYGRRRPWMIAGTALCSAAMLLLGYTRGFAAIFTGWNTPSNDSLTIILAVVSIYLIDFSINAVMAMDRALLVDTLPPVVQASGNAWAARMLGIGAVFGFFVGTIPLPSMFPFLGSTQLEVLSVIVSILLLAGHVIMLICVKERVLLKNNDQNYPAKRPNAFIRELRALWSNFRTLPSVIRQICMIQFFAWIAWFPLLFYSTLYIGDLYKRANPISSNPDAAELHRREAEATRLGTRALFYSAILSLFLNLVLPACVATPVSRSRARDRVIRTRWWRRLKMPERLKVNLASLWAVGHLVLGLCMFGTFLTDSVEGATLLISITGFSWAITAWAPFSLLGEAILTSPDPDARRTSILLSDARTPTHGDDEAGTEGQAFLSGHGHDEPEAEGEHFEPSDDESDSGSHGPPKSRHGVSGILGNPDARTSMLHVGLNGRDTEWGDSNGHGGPSHDQIHDGGEGRSDTGGLSAKAGVILGIHNVSIVVPQFLVTGLSAIIFAIFDPVRPHPGHIPPPPRPPQPTALPNSRRAIEMQDVDGKSNSVVYIFRLGGLAAFIAFVLCWRLARQLRH